MDTNAFTLNFRFISLKDLEFYFAEVNPEYKDSNYFESLQIDVSGGSKIIRENKLVTIELTITYFVVLDKKATDHPVILRYRSATTFFISNFDEVFKLNNENNFVTDKRVSQTLLGISISTIRGVLIEKTANSELSNFPLPIISPDSISDLGDVKSISAEVSPQNVI